MDWSTKQILITGGTGSFGRRFVRTLLDASRPPKRQVVFSRDELKQHEMRVAGVDVRNRERLRRAFDGINVVIQPLHRWWKVDADGGHTLPEGFSYSSDNNEVWLSAEELSALAGQPA